MFLFWGFTGLTRISSFYFLPRKQENYKAKKPTIKRNINTWMYIHHVYVCNVLYVVHVCTHVCVHINTINHTCTHTCTYIPACTWHTWHTYMTYPGTYIHKYIYTILVMLFALTYITIVVCGYSRHRLHCWCPEEVELCNHVIACNAWFYNFQLNNF